MHSKKPQWQKSTKKSSWRSLVSTIVVASILVACSGELDLPTQENPQSKQATVLRPSPIITSAPASGAACGVERWAVKTLMDSDASKVNFVPKRTTIESLSALPAPSSLPAAKRVPPIELETYTLLAQVNLLKLEEDSDIHLVISSIENPKVTMIAEFPHVTACTLGDLAGQRTSLLNARQDLVSLCGEPSSRRFLPCSVSVEITGVGFFDRKHGQTGVAPNAIELHPVLAIRRAPGALPAR
ncbi:MAG: hypothetical protein EXR49_02510 [Dehalococcoidia bacterium]|nr:hypothetical protein [Dehalococcoidia bacterium]